MQNRIPVTCKNFHHCGSHFLVIDKKTGHRSTYSYKYYVPEVNPYA